MPQMAVLLFNPVFNYCHRGYHLTLSYSVGVLRRTLNNF